MRTWLLKVHRALLEPTDIAGLCAFRMLFGFTMAGALLRFGLRGWVTQQWTAPTFHFAYPGLSFVTVGSAPLMHALLAMLIVCALCLALGIYTRVAAACFAVGFTYTELIDQANYLNHYYLVSLLSILLFLVPCGRAHSVDVWRRPELQVDYVPRFCVVAIQAQVLLVYFFAGVAKLNADWLFDAQPMRIWLSARSSLPWIGPYLTDPNVAYAASWAGALFDLVVGPALLFRRTRRPAFAIAVMFHVVTSLLFPIGVFPWLMTVCLTLFFEPTWPERLALLLSRALQRVLGRQDTPHSAQALERRARPFHVGKERIAGTSRWLLAVLLVHTLVQVAVPIFQYRNTDSAWTYRGFNFAWRVMVAEKTGYVTYRVEDRHTGARWSLSPTAYLTRWQVRAMVQDPELIRDLARYMADEQLREGRVVAVYADAFAALNGRPAERLIDPDLDLSGPLPDDWVLPRASGLVSVSADQAQGNAEHARDLRLEGDLHFTRKLHGPL